MKTTRISTHRRLSFLLALLILLLVIGIAQAAPYGTITTFAPVPADPGFPEGVAVQLVSRIIRHPGLSQNGGARTLETA